jgi:ABC-type amino acid transport system permease subunit
MVITLIKDTSLAFAIAVSEMFTVCKGDCRVAKTMAAFLAAGFFYYIFNFIVAFVMERLEKSPELLPLGAAHGRIKHKKPEKELWRP